ncbi:MAG: VanZ family protein [Bacteroidia bacterium]|nr:VanZ family protein [Bacteroidia bacterium]
MFIKHGLTPLSTAIFILIVCLIPGSGIPDAPFSGMDKLIHAFMFGVLAFQTLTFFRKQYSVPFLRLSSVKACVLFCTIFGALIELLQGSFVQNRSADLSDLLADILGTGCGLLVFGLIHGKFKHT